jgi:aminoglycoside phosphotransferase (APT) family kinase protein/putative sterol carrier protein
MLSHGVDLSEIQSKLPGWLQHKLPQAHDLSVSDVERVGAGFTNVSIPFTLRWQEAGQQRTAGMLFRAAGTSDPVYPDFKLERQFRVMQSLQYTNVPVPKVYWMETDEAVLGFPFYIMSKVEGVVPSEYPPYHSFGVCYDATPALRAKMWWGTLAAMVKVHQVDWKRQGLDFLGVPPAGTGPIDRELAYWEHYLNWAKEERQPILDAALDWLQRHRYAPARVTLCWGDARLPNTMFSPDGEVRAVLDWDMAILNDPESDLAFMIVLDWLLSEGTGVPRLEGFPSQEDTIHRYETLTGWRVENFSYNEVFATFRAALVVLRVQKSLQHMGIELPGEDPILDNLCTRRLAALLHLPAPGASTQEIARTEEVSGTIQLHLTGPGGGDWHVVADNGRATRHDGQARSPDATLTISAADWAAIQRGEMNSFNAWTSGKLKVAGNHTLYQQLADRIAKM